MTCVSRQCHKSDDDDDDDDDDGEGDDGDDGGVGEGVGGEHDKMRYVSLSTLTASPWSVHTLTTWLTVPVAMSGACS